MATYLAKKGNVVHIFTSWRKGLASETSERGFFIHRIRYYPIRVLGAILFWMRMLFLLRKVNPDVIHAQGIVMGIPAFLGKRILNKPYSVWGQGSDVYSTWAFKTTFTRLVLRNANLVIALTQDMRLRMQQICDVRAVIIPNGVRIESFSGLSREKSRKNLNILENEKIITFVGRLVPEKGVKYLIRAMTSINRNVPDARLLLIGDGLDRLYLEKLTQELKLTNTITFVGMVSNEKVPSYLASSDLFVLPTLSEGLSIVILEAMACGLPVITTTVNGLPEIVKDGENGLLVAPKNSEQLAQKLLLLLNDDQLRMKMGENNKRLSKNYSLEVVFSKFESQLFLATKK